MDPRFLDERGYPRGRDFGERLTDWDQPRALRVSYRPRSLHALVERAQRGMREALRDVAQRARAREELLS